VPQIFTLVAYGDMTELSATLQNANLSDFEIIANPSKQATGNGGYLATVSVKPKHLLPIGTHSDNLILMAKNQGKEFSFEVPLDFYVEDVNDNNRPYPVASSNHITQVRNGISLSLKSSAIVEIYGLKGNLIQRQNFSSGNYTISLGHLPKGMYIAKVSFNDRSSFHTLRIPVM
jgi:hypothetical protein